MSAAWSWVSGFAWPWRGVGYVVLVLAWLAWRALSVPSLNVYRTLGPWWLAGLWALWAWAAVLIWNGWEVLDSERKNLDDALAIQAGGLRFLGRTKRKVQLVFSAKLHYAAFRLEVGSWVLVGSWLVTLLWAWWLVVLPVVGFARRLLRSRRDWWLRA